MTAPVSDYFPGEWLPHVTVLQEIPQLRIGEALQALLDVLPALPLQTRVESIGVITFRPGFDVLRFELGTGRSLLQLSGADSKL